MCMKTHKKYKPGSSKAEQDWLREQERKDLIISFLIMVAGLIALTIVVNMAFGEAL